MSIAEKLLQVTTNEQLISDGLATEAELIAEIKDMVDNLPEAEQTGGDDLWQYVYGMSNTFQKATFPTDYELVLNVPFLSTMTQVFDDASNLKKITFTGGNTTSGAGGIGGTYHFRNSTIVEIDVSNFRNGGIRFASGAKYAFYGCTRLKYIRGEIDMSIVSTTTNFFYTCNQLIEVRFKANTIKGSLSITSQNLSADSLQSLVDGYADMTEQTSPTLTVHSTVGEKFTDEQKATLAAKNITLVY